MTKKEKAEELLSKHYAILFDSDSDKGEEILVFKLAKKSAMVTIEESLRMFYRLASTQRHLWDDDQKALYQEIMDVKQELEKL